MGEPVNEVWDDCPACQYELEQIGPVHGPELPPRRTAEWSMTPREWAGDGPIKYFGK